MRSSRFLALAFKISIALALAASPAKATLITQTKAASWNFDLFYSETDTFIEVVFQDGLAQVPFGSLVTSTEGLGGGEFSQFDPSLGTLQAVDIVFHNPTSAGLSVKNPTDSFQFISWDVSFEFGFIIDDPALSPYSAIIETTNNQMVGSEDKDITGDNFQHLGRPGGNADFALEGSINILGADMTPFIGLDTFDFQVFNTVDFAVASSSDLISWHLAIPGGIRFDIKYTFLPASTPDPPPVTVPEPTTLALFVTGLAGLGFMMRRRRRST